jgi:hypothetical protein
MQSRYNSHDDRDGPTQASHESSRSCFGFFFSIVRSMRILFSIDARLGRWLVMPPASGGSGFVASEMAG